MDFSPKLTEMIERNRSGAEPQAEEPQAEEPQAEPQAPAEPQAEISEGTAEDQAAIDALFDAIVENADGDE